jgi:4-amino-4-deoxy-L-arabinose transferase-like glycosyltransferase
MTPMTRAAGLQAFALIAILCAGIFFRVHATIPYNKLGFDEGMYRNYLRATQSVGALHYQELVGDFMALQNESQDAMANPLRVFYILSSYFYMELTHCEPLAALHAVSAAAGVLHLLVACLFAWRVGGRAAALGMAALMAFEPLQLALSQSALVDGTYAFWAVACFWLLWENLRAPDDGRWLAAYCASLFLMVLTKENSAFVMLALCGLIVTNRWLGYGIVTPRLLVMTVIVPAAALVILISYAGGIGAFLNFYLTFVRKSSTLDYAMVLQDGPWTRYLFDFLMLTPLVTLLAVGRVFQLKGANRADVYSAMFLALCYVPMASVKYGMSVRFAGFWDLPLCWLAWSQLRALAGKIAPRRRDFVLCIAVLLVSATGFWQYCRVFVFRHTYDPVTRAILMALDIYK